MHPLPLNFGRASWIWAPFERTLPNTFVLFRKEFHLDGDVKSAKGLILADSRYKLTVNGFRIQWGPAVSDPRTPEADPLDLQMYLKAGSNVIGVEVLFFGHGDGTWVEGNPGLLLHLEIIMTDGTSRQIESNTEWHCKADRAHRPGQHKQWFLRALQEEFDARLHPLGWDRTGYQADGSWLHATELAIPAYLPSLASPEIAEMGGSEVQSQDAMCILPRQLPMMAETLVTATLAGEGVVHWKQAPEDWFDFRVQNSFELDPLPDPLPLEVERPPTDDRVGRYLLFHLPEEMAGWPVFEIEAGEGTIVEWMGQESHDPGNPPWLDTHFHTWVRWICREGINRFETFDFFAVRWMQLHIRSRMPIRVHRAQFRRRYHPFPELPKIESDEPALTKLISASLNTIRNSCMDTVADGTGRERQQYGGDGAHQLQAVRAAFGGYPLSARYLRTFTQGLTPDGYFLDCWPAYDRIQRVGQRMIGTTRWGPILDHGIQIPFECFHHYMHSGRKEEIQVPLERTRVFAEYLLSLRRGDGLLPVENLGIPSVWMDHEGFERQQDKQCAFNLYAAAMYSDALAPLLDLLGQHEEAIAARESGASLVRAAVSKFWCVERQVFADNLPWATAQEPLRFHDRTLATAILYKQCPEGMSAESLRLLCRPSLQVGRSYPANAGWRLWALAKNGHERVVLDELRTVWASLPSVAQNNSLQEHWVVRPDSCDEWSHCPLTPLSILFTDIAGIRPTAPGFRKAAISPRLGNLRTLSLTYQTPIGGIEFTAKQDGDRHVVSVRVPAGCKAEFSFPISKCDGDTSWGTIP